MRARRSWRYNRIAPNTDAANTRRAAGGPSGDNSTAPRTAWAVHMAAYTRHRGANVMPATRGIAAYNMSAVYAPVLHSRTAPPSKLKAKRISAAPAVAASSAASARAARTPGMSATLATDTTR
jgi:hypothetical protein